VETGNRAASACGFALDRLAMSRLNRHTLRPSIAGSIAGTIVAIRRSNCGVNGTRRAGRFDEKCRSFLEAARG
jgi:hypothetical protein